LPMTASEMAGYAGKYGQREASVEIFVKDGKLFLRQGRNDLPVRKVGENRFVASAAGSDAALEFALVFGVDGQAQYFQGGLRSAIRIRK